jgi:hypothetical protein
VGRHKCLGLPDRLESPGCRTISAGLKIHIHHIAIPIHCPPQEMLFATDFDEDFVNVECVAVASVLALQ